MVQLLDSAFCEDLSSFITAPEDGSTMYLEDSPLDGDSHANSDLESLADEWSESALCSAEQIMAVQILGSDSPLGEISLEPSVAPGPEPDQNANRLRTAAPLSPALGELVRSSELSTNAAEEAIALTEEIEGSATLPARCRAPCRLPVASLHDDSADYDQAEETNEVGVKAVRDSEPGRCGTEQVSSPSVSTRDLAESPIQPEDESTVLQASSLRSNTELDSNHQEEVAAKAPFVRCEVEHIIDSEVVEGQLQYIVWLKEWEPSCVSADCMDDCNDALAEFHNQHRDRPGFRWAARRIMPRKKLSEDMFGQWLHKPGSTAVRRSLSVSDKPTAHLYTRKSPRKATQTDEDRYRMDKHPMDKFLGEPCAGSQRKRVDSITKAKRLRVT